MRYLWILLLAGCSVEASVSTPRVSPDTPAVRRIIFAGDCVTAQGNEPGGYVTLIRERLSAKGIEVLGAGVNADTLDGLQRRFDYDVLDLHPSLIVLCEGINDVRPTQVNVGATNLRTQYISGPLMWRAIMTNLIARTPCPVVLCTPALLGEAKQNEFDGRLDEFAEIVRQVASENKCKLCDFRKAFRSTSGPLTKDGRHFNAAGNKLAAETILHIIEP